MLYRISELNGSQLEARDGTIGRLKDLYFDDQTWTVRYLAVDTGGWLSGRRVLLSPAVVRAPKFEERMLPVDLTRDQIEKSPAASTEKPVSRQHETDLHRYYGWTPYWPGGMFPVTGVAPLGPAVAVPTYSPPPAEGATRRAGAEDEGDPHLRSAAEVVGYHINARDDELGHVEDLVIDGNDWTVRLLVVDTRNWWPGKKVAVPRDRISRISWTDQSVTIELERETIKNGPEYPGRDPLSAGYERQVAAYFNEVGTAR